MKLWSDSFNDGGVIPGEFAFCVMHPDTHVTLSGNRNPHLAWSEVPAGTKSFVLICHDPDVPSRGDDVNQEGTVVPPDLPRVEFFHWTMIDLPAERRVIDAGEFCDGVTTGGKDGPELPGFAGIRHGLNDYTEWFAGDATMRGDYFGYDGPCPPWNDSIVHRYIFSLYALGIARLPVEGKFTAQQVRDAIHGNVLDKAHMTAIYTLNAAMARKL